MSTLTVHVTDIDLGADSPARRLRHLAAAVRVHFTWWGTRRTLTKEQKAEAAQPFDAAGEFLSASKKIVDTSHPAWKRLTGVKTAIGHYWKGCSLPYVEPGVRLIRQADVEAFVAQLTWFQADLKTAEQELDRAYADLKEGARARLGSLFDPADYPPVIRDLFQVEWDFPSIEPPSYLLQLSPEVYRAEQDRVARQFEEAVRLAEATFTAELAGMVGHLAERLAPDEQGAKKVFRDSALDNLREFFRKFRGLSVQSNADLEALVQRAENLVRDISPAELRRSDSWRQEVRSGMADIGQQLEGMLVNQPRRRIVRPQVASE
jgi:hypothetical protein